MKSNIRPTVGCILTKDDKVLLTLRNHEPFKDCFCIPGGHIEKDESPIDAVIREVKEETGADIKPRFFCYDNEYFPDINWHAIAIVFSAAPTGTLKRCEKEVKELRWFSFSEINELKTAFNHKKILNKFFKKDITVDKKRIERIITNSKEVGNSEKDIIDMIYHHAEEIKELYEKNDKHFSVETGDLIILALELLIKQGYDAESIIENCYDRFDKKLKELIEKKGNQ